MRYSPLSASYFTLPAILGLPMSVWSLKRPTEFDWENAMCDEMRMSVLSNDFMEKKFEDAEFIP
jgi:hypothetical protein